MNAPWVSRLGETLVAFVWQGCIVAVLYAAVRIVVRRARVRYVTGCLAMIAMLAAPAVTFVRSAPRGVGSTAPVRNAAPARSVWSTTPSAPLNGSEPLAPPAAMPWLVGAWFAGAALFGVRLAAGWSLACRMRSVDVCSAPLEWRQVFARLCGALGVRGPVELLISGRAVSPAVVGWLKPVVLLPVGTLAGMPVAQVEALLLHELAHIRRHDYLVNVLQCVCEAMLFYHPAVWWISREIRREREHCCDDITVAVTDDAITYAEALAELDGARFGLAMAAGGGSLERRIARLLGIQSGARAVFPFAALLPLAIGAGLLLAQTGPAVKFEVASIKLSPPEYVGFQSYVKGDRYTAMTATVRNLVAWAYGVEDFQISGGPSWASSTAYNVNAKMSEATRQNDARPMMQALLAERFGLRFHRETKERAGYALVVDKGAPKLKERTTPGPGLGLGRGSLRGVGANLGQLTKELSAQIEAPVVDRTGFTAIYDFTLTWSPDPQTNPDGPSLNTALREQLGLRLEPVKNVPVEYFVIDAVNQPTED